jgi:L-fuculose-phosphate aldolase
MSPPAGGARRREVPRDVAEARRAVLEAAQRMSHLGLVVSTWGNVSARVAGRDLVAITPSGVEYDALREEMLCVLDHRGALVHGGLRPSSEALLHLAIYRARPDVGGIVHTHSVYASAHAAARLAVPPVVEELAQVVGGPIECAPYARAGTAALARAAAAALGDRNAVLLANHGLVGVGATPRDALRVCIVAEQGALIHSVARAIGVPALLSPEEVGDLRHDYLCSYGQTRGRSVRRLREARSKE